ncbi:hypothetical protein [Microbacterium aurum]
MSPRTRDRVERASIRVYYALIASIIVCLLVPLLIQMVSAFVYGLSTGHWLSAQGLLSEGDYVLWDTQLWLVWVPVACAVAWIAMTIPVPLRRPGVPGRGQQFVMLLIMAIAGIPRIGAIGSTPPVPSAGTQYLLVVVAALAAVVMLRIALGALRLLPRSWRRYLDESGAEIVPAPLGRAARRNPLSEIPQ